MPFTNVPFARESCQRADPAEARSLGFRWCFGVVRHFPLQSKEITRVLAIVSHFLARKALYRKHCIACKLRGAWKLRQ